MVNHLRTLLLGRFGTETQDPVEFGEEYVPPDFSPQTMSQELTQVRQVIFGISPDRAMLNYRLCELLNLCHNARLIDYVTFFDPRITYKPGLRSDIFNRLAQKWVVTTTAGTGSLSVIGAPREMLGRLRLVWQLRVIDSSHLGITAKDSTEVSVGYTTTSGVGNAALSDQPDVVLYFDPTTDNAWTLEGFARPLTSLPEVLSRLSGATEQTLFLSTPDVEPYRTFRNLWQRTDHPGFRLAAATLSLGWLIDAARSV